jgi:hypothetical protein
MFEKTVLRKSFRPEMCEVTRGWRIRVLHSVGLYNYLIFVIHYCVTRVSRTRWVGHMEYM